MSFQQFFTILRARWLSALAVLATVVATTVIVSLLMPKQYTADAAVLLDVRSPDPVAGVMLTGMMAPGYMATQVDLIQSERVARRAISALRLAENADLRNQWQEATHGQGDFEAWVAALLGKKLDVRPSRESNVISVAYTSADPRFSAALANAYVRGYIDTTLDLRVEPARQYNTFFDDRSKKLRDDLEAAQTRLSAYQRQKGIVASDERLDVENMRLAEIFSQVVAMESAAAEAASRRSQAAASPERMQEVLNNPVVAQLQADLSRQEARLQELNSRLGDAHPQVIELRSNIDGLRAKMTAATERASGSVTITNTVAQQRLAQLRAARDEQRAKVLRLKTERDEITVLQRDVENAQRAYDAVLARVNQTSLESQNTQTNVSVVKAATPPAVHSSPKLLLNTALAVFLGVLLAVATALLRELLDPRMRTPDDVTEQLKQPLLVVMPKPAALNRSEARGYQRLVSPRLASTLPQPSR